MGLVLAKGIMFSLITVVFFMPAMILKFTKWNDKTRHRPFLPSFRKFSEWVYRVRYASLIIMVLLTPPAYVAQGMNDFLYGNSAVGASEGDPGLCGRPGNIPDVWSEQHAAGPVSQYFAGAGKGNVR